MIRTLKMSLKIDMTYAINSFIYHIRKLPVFKDLFTDDIYKSNVLKTIVIILGIILSAGRMILFRFLYFFVIYLISQTISKKDISSGFIHIYFIFTIIGMFINSDILSTSTKKYFSIILFSMDAKEYMKSSLFWDLLTTLILNSLCLGIFSIFIEIPIYILIMLLIFTLFVRLIGGAFSVWFYKRYNYIWYNNYGLYFTILGILLGCSLLSYFGVYVSDNIIFISMVLGFILSIISLFYLFRVDDYKLMFKRLNTEKIAMNSENSKAYSRQSMVEVRNKDKYISEEKIKNKKGYDLFNTIFFERHKEILSRSAKNYSIIIGVIYIVLFVFIHINGHYTNTIHNFLLNNLGWFVLIMYFVNRGAIITQAMFFNCDHAMLTYNFYREPKVLLGLFKRRLVTVVKVNLIPAIVICIGNLILLYITGGSSVVNYISSSLFILLLSIFFSVHYMVIYYLLQPYNKDMEVKKVSYSVVTLATYFIAYALSDVVLSSVVFSLLGVLFTIIYIVIALILVYKRACKTFKLN